MKHRFYWPAVWPLFMFLTCFAILLLQVVSRDWIWVGGYVLMVGYWWYEWNRHRFTCSKAVSGLGVMHLHAENGGKVIEWIWQPKKDLVYVMPADVDVLKQFTEATTVMEMQAIASQNAKRVIVR